MKMTGSEAIVHALILEGVGTLFGYPGGAIMPTYDALFDVKDQLRHILVRHEQGAVHAAEGYARATGKVGVCLATSGPGATNLITGIADAMLDSVPVVCITGQVHSHLLGTDAFQETDIVSMTLPITKWNAQVTNAKDIPQAISKAFYLAREGRPGPVLLDFTKDAQLGSLDFNYHSQTSLKQIPVCFDEDNLRKAAQLINTAQRPYLLIGQGVLLAHAQTEVFALADKCDIPVATTLLGLSAFPSKHPLFVGMLGMHGNYAANKLVNEADVIVAIGMRFDDRVTGNLTKFARQAKIIHIDIDTSEINKNVPVEIALCADAKSVLNALLLQVKQNQHNLWKQLFQQHHLLEYESVIKHETKPQQGPIKMAEVVSQLSEMTNGTALIVTDVGQHQMIAARYYQFENTLSHITSGGLGTMGYALPAAIGAKLGQPKREVIAIIGDGGFQMNIQELAVIAQESLVLKIVILNNQYLGMVRQWQDLFFSQRYSQVELTNPDFIKLAEAYSIPAMQVTDRGQINNAIQTMLDADTAYLLEFKVEQQHNVFPMIPTGAGISEMRLA